MNHLLDSQGERIITNDLSEEDIIYWASVKQSPTKTKANFAARDSGLFNGSHSDWLEDEKLKLKHFEQIHYVRTKESARLGREALAESQKQLGLSKGAKVGQKTGRKHVDRLRTTGKLSRNKSESICVENHDHDLTRHAVMDGCGWYKLKHAKQTKSIPDKYGRTFDMNITHQWRTDTNGKAQLLRREWSNQYKIQMVYSPRPSDAPAPQQGERYTEKLTSRAVTKIFESGAYVAACHGGFNTFLTLTFSPEIREQILANKGSTAYTKDGLEYCPLPTTISKETSRMMDGLKKMYQRGFKYVAGEENDNSPQRNITLCNERVKVAGHKGRTLRNVYRNVDNVAKTAELCGPTKKPHDFHYIWVAECPMNENGEPNPHVHVLLRWQVEKEHFQGWAKRVESLWGNGMAHLERIKHADAAAPYLIKAIGYAAKGENADQGLIRGQRYNIARCSRALPWEVLASFDADNMHAIIKECGYRLERWRKPLQKEIGRKKKKQEEAKKAFNIHKKTGNQRAQFKLKRLIENLDNEIKDIKTNLNSRRVFARSDNTFSICFEGEGANIKVDDFLYWAAGARNWSMKCADIDMSDIKKNADIYHKDDYQRFLETRADWQSQLNQHLPDFDVEQYNIMQSIDRETVNHYEQYNFQ
jgi:hypothetical protein